MKKLKAFGFVIDPLSHFNPKTETTLFLMREAQKRGYRILTFELSQLFYRQGTVYGKGLEIDVLNSEKSSKTSSFYHPVQTLEVDLAELHALFLRKDPPFDLEYLNHLHLLSLIRNKVLMVNDPRGILNAAEKVFPLQFENLIPQTWIGRNWAAAQDFASSCPQGVVLKPIDSFGGRSVFRFQPEDSNFKVAFEVLSQEGQRFVIVQEYLPAVRIGDKRVLLLNGEILGYFLRVPQSGDHRANLHSGGSLQPCQLSLQEKNIVETLKPHLLEHGLSFVGIDLIGEKLTEVNVTSPMGINEVNSTLGGQCEQAVLDFVETNS